MGVINYNLSERKFCEMFRITSQSYQLLRTNILSKCVELGINQRFQPQEGHPERWEQLMRFARQTPWLRHLEHALTPGHKMYKDQLYRHLQGKILGFLGKMRVKKRKERMEQRAREGLKEVHELHCKKRSWETWDAVQPGTWWKVKQEEEAGAAIEVNQEVVIKTEEM